MKTDLSIDTDALASKALEMGADGVDALERVLALAERERDYRARLAYDEAMLAVQAEIPQIVKRHRNPETRSQYAQLEDIDRAIRPIYTSHGFRVSFTTVPIDRAGWTLHRAQITHTGGHHETVEAAFPLDNVGPKGGKTRTETQGVASSLSYAQRRLTCMAFNVVVSGEDRDGNAPTPVSPPITEEQAANLQALADEIMAPDKRDEQTAATLAWASQRAGFEISTWSEIPSDLYAHVVRALERKRT